MQNNKQAIFDSVWEQMARQGACDSKGGSEYQRVFRTWFAAGCPENIAAYIWVQANLPAYGERPIQADRDLLKRMDTNLQLICDCLEHIRNFFGACRKQIRGKPR